ncbi:hypothetical protein GALMADRAFT_218456 [Galerina marginata CBS 339.88]|uniref:Homeobox domain-containing protein n=1 Tax=Galerina marginata (strain CBS 339.88) TaxID=685588 RepID=A0A067TQ74_GALM3|nr:hypothetical protein GALMADRAFT_218456 [Galerina marginata CBS 339.88]
MTSTSSSTQVPSQLGPLHFLASVISDIGDDESSSHRSLSSEPFSGQSSPTISATSHSAAPFHDVANLHVPCNSPRPQQATGYSDRVLRHSTSSNHPPSDSNFVPFLRHKSGRRTRKTAQSHLNNRVQMKNRRKELMDKASKIKSLDNSPVNERQLLVLRMVYDEITMYPCESWMVLLAIVINRAYKQVKNWFSNERQKNRTGESVPLETEDGDKVRLRSSALETCQEWSDSFFEEVVMIYNYRIQRNSRFRGSLRRPDSSSHD